MLYSGKSKEDFMKRITFIIVFVLLIAALAACNQPDGPSHLVKVPKLSEQIGYDFSVNGIVLSSDVTAGEYIVEEGETLEFLISAHRGYTLADIQVKDNGIAVVLADASDADGEKRSFKIENINKVHTITVTGVKLARFNVKFNKAKYPASEGDTAGVVYEDYDDSYIVIKYGDEEYYSIDDAIAAINDMDLTLEYGETFTLWIGEIYKNCFDSADLRGCLYSTTPDFSGIIGVLNDGQYEYVLDTEKASRIYPAMENGVDIEENNLYKFEITVEGDLNLYFDTVVLNRNPVYYDVKIESNEVYGIEVEPAAYHLVLSTEWSFRIIEKITDGSVDYSQMRVYVNGEDVTNSADEGFFTFVGLPPSAFNEGGHTNYGEFVITVSDVDLSDHEDDLVKIKIEPNERVNNTTFMWDGDGGESPAEMKTPFYIENGYYYFFRDDNPYIYFNVSKIYDTTNMRVKANGEEVTVTPIPVDDYGVDNKYEIKLDNYITNTNTDQIIIEIEYIEYKRITYTIKNDLSNEVDLFLYIGNEDPQLITGEVVLDDLIHDDTFMLRIDSKTGAHILDVYNISGLDEQNLWGTGTGSIAGSSNISSLDFHVRVNAFIDANGRTINVVKD
jgi:hypothetical protein